MRATDLVRSVLDLLDKLEAHEEQEQVEIVPVSPCEQPPEGRFKQIFSMLNDPNRGYDNSPNEIIEPVASVTTHAGGGVNGPKNPADIRVKDPRGYQ